MLSHGCIQHRTMKKQRICGLTYTVSVSKQGNLVLDFTSCSDVTYGIKT